MFSSDGSGLLALFGVIVVVLIKCGVGLYTIKFKVPEQRANWIFFVLAVGFGLAFFIAVSDKKKIQ